MRRLSFRHENGVAMTEFALILPIFMVIVAGVLAFGRAFFYWIDADHLANETARWAVVDRNPYARRRCSSMCAGSSTVEFRRRQGLHRLPGREHPSRRRPCPCPDPGPFYSSRSSRSRRSRSGHVDDAHRAIRWRRTAPTTYPPPRRMGRARRTGLQRARSGNRPGGGDDPRFLLMTALVLDAAARRAQREIPGTAPTPRRSRPETSWLNRWPACITDPTSESVINDVAKHYGRKENGGSADDPSVVHRSRGQLEVRHRDNSTS